MKNFKNLINKLTHINESTIAQYIMGIGIIVNLLMVASAIFIPFIRDSKFVPYICIISTLFVIYAFYYMIMLVINSIKETKLDKQQDEIDLISTIFSWEKIDNIPINKAYTTQIRGALKDIIGIYSNRSAETLEDELENDSMITDCEIALSNLRYL